jgi:hypothetical protein
MLLDAMPLTDVFCVHLPAEKVLIATREGRCWLTSIETAMVTALPVSPVAAQRSTLAAGALEGAITAGLGHVGPIASTFSHTLPRYIRWLVGNYVFAGQTPGVFRRAAERFEASLRPDLAEFARKKAAEEDGHADLAYRDLESLGLPAAEVIRLIRPPSADAFADRFRMYAEQDNPIAMFGFSYCLERMAVGRDDLFVQKIRSICPNASAMRFLKVHSNIGSDGAHVEEQLLFFESIDGESLAAVALAAFETAEMLARQPLMDHLLTDAEICRRLARAGMTLPTTRSERTGNVKIRGA